GGTAVAWPLAARAQQAKAATIGLLRTGTAAAQSQWTAAFVQRMRELGWVEGCNLAIEYRWGEGRTERFASSKLHRTSRPASTIRTEPVTYDASSEASQRIG